LRLVVGIWLASAGFRTIASGPKMVSLGRELFRRSLGSEMKKPRHRPGLFVGLTDFSHVRFGVKNGSGPARTACPFYPPSGADIVRPHAQVRFVPRPEVFSGLGHVPLARWMSSPPTTAGARHARVSNIWSRAGRSTTCICYCSSRYRGSHICPRNLRLDSHIAPCPSLLLPVS
jgi:hypothetical protein